MSGAGRGTPRSSPYEGAIPSLANSTEGPAQTSSITPVTSARWGYELDITRAAPLVLTASSVAYTDNDASNEFKIPYGAVRGAIVGEYTPGIALGQVGIAIRWGGVADLFVYQIADVPGAVYGVAGDPTTVKGAEIDHYLEYQVTPPAPDVTPIQFVLPFWVPPMLDHDRGSGGNDPPYIEMTFFVREASGLAFGSLLINKLWAENFGTAQPVART